MEKVFISIGSNIGDSISYCRKAAVGLARTSKVDKLSSLYETEPVGKEDQPNFINAAVLLTTNLSAHELLKEIHKIENELGRVRYERWGPRTIDLDIIFYGDSILNDDDLIIPHPRAHLREFVLKPICEIDPDFIYPGKGLPVSKVLEQISDQKKVLKLDKPFTIS